MTTEKTAFDEDDIPLVVLRNQRKSEERKEVTNEGMKPFLIMKVPKRKLWYISHKQKKHLCEICEAIFIDEQQLLCHIRKLHFNLYAKTPCYKKKNINETWIEKVSNTDDLIEITKTSPNTLLMKKFNSNTDVEVDEADEVEDLSYMYPTEKKYKHSKKYKKHKENFYLKTRRSED